MFIASMINQFREYILSLPLTEACRVNRPKKQHSHNQSTSHWVMLMCNAYHSNNDLLKIKVRQL